MSRHTAHLLWRLLLGLGLLAICSACGSSGCQGCTPAPIPGGFPVQHKFDNAMQVRLSSSGLSFLEKNLGSLISMLVPGGLNFTIPPTGCTSGNQKICCNSTPCTATLAISSAQLTPTPQSTLKLNLRAAVQTSKIKFEQYVLFDWISCDITYNSAKATPSTLGMLADVNFVIDAANQNKMKIVRGATTLQDFDCGDIDITGGALCTVADWFCPLFKGMIEDKLMETLDSTVDNMLKSLPMGQEGRFDVASFMQSFSPQTKGSVDYMMWGGGYAAAENAGMSFGVMGGFRPAQYSICVPNCEKPGATCAPPSAAPIPRSPVFGGNLRPDGKAFDVGIGVAASALDRAAYAMYASGGLCIDVSSRSFSQLSSFTMLVPSTNGLTNGEQVPFAVSVRPRKPPTVLLGKGTYHTDAGGKVVIDDPLLKITAKDFAIDMMMQLDERMVRLFTVVGTLQVPVLLFADASGRLQPMLGSLDKALTDVRIENNDLITENPDELSKAIPTILGLAGSFLASGFDPIELPSIEKLKLLLDGGSITSTDTNKVLAIFANLGLVQSAGAGGSGSLPLSGPVKTRAVQEELWVPPGGAFRVGPGFETERGPRLTLRLDAEVPPGLDGQPLEWAYRVDGGFFHPWTSARRLVIHDALFWLQGEHTVEVMARVKDRPETTDPQPVQLSFVVDTVAPRVRLVPVPGGVRAELQDLGTGADRLELSWSIGGGPYGPFGRELEVRALAGTTVSVKVRDAAGNLSSATAMAGAALTVAEPVEQGGCAMAGRSSGAASAALAAAALALLLLFRRRCR